MAEENSKLDVIAPRLHWAMKYTHRDEFEWSRGRSRETHLWMVLKGKLTAEFENQIFEAKPQALIVIPAGVIQRIQTAPDTQVILVSFALAGFQFDETARSIEPNEDTKFQYAGIQSLMENILLLWNLQALDRSVTSPLLTALLEYLKRIEQRHVVTSALHPSLAIAVHYLEQNIAAPVTLDELARYAHVSSGYLQVLFHRQLGCSALQYLQDLRLKRAMHLLHQTSLPLDHIAQKCGYADTDYFIRLFRKKTGLPPRQWRMSKRNENPGA